MKVYTIDDNKYYASVRNSLVSLDCSTNRNIIKTQSIIIKKFWSPLYVVLNEMSENSGTV